MARRWYAYETGRPTDAQRIADCQARVANEISNINKSNMLASQKILMLQKLNKRKLDCVTHPPIGVPGQGQGHDDGGNNGNGGKTTAEKIAACKARVTDKIARTNTSTSNMPAAQKAAL